MNTHTFEKKGISIDLIEKKVANKNTIVIFRLKNDFISELTVENLEGLLSNNPNLEMLDFKLESHSDLLGKAYFFERLPKFYFYKAGEMVFSTTGSTTSLKIEEYIAQIYGE